MARLNSIIFFSTLFLLISSCGTSPKLEKGKKQGNAKVLKTKSVVQKNNKKISKLRVNKITMSPKAGTELQRIGVMTYNVDNLFDYIDDVDKNDETFLPLAQKKNKSQKKICDKIVVEKWKAQCFELDWSKETYSAKLANIGNVILATNHGAGADIVLLQEVENIRVLNDLIAGPLKGKGYITAELIEGEDLRGIDVAVLSKLPLAAQSKSFEIPFHKIESWRKADTRPILKVTLKLNDEEDIDVYSLHLPAPFHPYKFRLQALEYLKTLVTKESPGKLFVIGGDFNFPVEEEILHSVTGKLNENFIVVHKEGCRECLGTSYYPPRGTWSFLDMLLTSRIKENMASENWSVDINSVKVINSLPKQKKLQGIPREFHPEKKIGYSDHFPLYFELFRQ